MINEAILASLRELTEGLWYVTETDSTFEVCAWDRSIPEQLAQTLSQYVKMSALPVEEFFIPLLEMKNFKTETGKEMGLRYEKLLQGLQNMLTDLKVYRVGETEIDIYIAGKTPEGAWVGLKTFAVET